MGISRRQRVADALVGRLLGQVPARTGYEVSPVRTPVRDGTVLLGDHYAPVGPDARGTVLIRTPYGRGLPTSALNGRLLAARGFHVVVQSVRGTFGSGGRFEPMAQEAADGQDTVAWLRTQPWFDGRLATLGGSYLGWTQWAILQDPPPELRTAVIYVGPHDFRAATWGTGAFTLGDFLGWSYQITRQEDGGGLRRAADLLAAGRKLRSAYAGLPLPEAAEAVLHGRAPWYREWAGRADGSDPWWEPYRATAALSRVTAPILLVSGWQDLFLEQTLEQYAVLAGRGVEVGLTVGPWTHLGVGGRAAGLVGRESIAWLDQHLAGAPPARRRPVRVFRTGERRWHSLPSWPPPSAPAVFHLHPTGALTLAHPTAHSETGQLDDPESAAPTNPFPDITPSSDSAAGPSPAGPISTDVPNEPAISDSSADNDTTGLQHDPPTGNDTTGLQHDPPTGNDTVGFRYDPSDPTPTLGGRTLTGSMGVKDNRPLQARPDVRAFSTDPLPTAVDVIGSPVLDLTLTTDTRDADVFVRLCDVDPRGRTHNFSDLMHRLDPAVPPGEPHRLTLTLDPCFHRLTAGHRLRLLVTGGSFPRYARAVGDAGQLRPSHRTIHCDASRLTLPVAPAEPAVQIP